MRLQLNELMVGDWVHPMGHQEIKAQVRPEDYINWAEYEPIPLTTEILEKNGFVCTQSDDEEIGTYESWFFQSDFITITCEPTLGMLDVFNGHLVKEIKFGIEESAFFVHELQHALRLCGIEKEIVL